MQTYTEQELHNFSRSELFSIYYKMFRSTWSRDLMPNENIRVVAKNITMLFDSFYKIPNQSEPKKSYKQKINEIIEKIQLLEKTIAFETLKL